MVWSQFGAAIDMLDNAVAAFPDHQWDDESECWYLAYHTIFWLDCYLDDSLETFEPPAPFTKDEMDPAGIMPDRTYRQDELRTYIEYCRKKCKKQLMALTDEKAAAPSVFDRPKLTLGELHLYNLRHVQHGAAQLNLHLRQKIDSAPGWVFRAKG
jgi:hypothetical protein